MKKTLFAALLSSIISTGAFAAVCGTAVLITAAGTGNATTATTSGNTCVCGGLTPGKVAYNGGSGTVILSSGFKFAKNGFDIQCSANTFVSVNEVNSTFASVGSVSAKGNQSMQGHTAGGAVTTSAKCAAANGVCAGGDANTANTAATNAGSSL